jgi:hypothetical protein
MACARSPALAEIVRVALERAPGWASDLTVGARPCCIYTA